MGTIRDLLMNPCYVGDSTWNRRSFAKFHRIENGRAVAAPKLRDRVVEHNDRDDWIVTRDPHFAIIPRETFEKAKTLRKTRARRPTQTCRGGRGATSSYLLTGVIACGRLHEQ